MGRVPRIIRSAMVAAEIRICALCRSSYRDPSIKVCPRDGGSLTDWSDDPLIGEVLDRYQIVEPLGQGGMGSVYLAERLPDELEVAVKVVRSEHIGNPTIHERFLREVKHTTNIQSPHVVEIFDSGMSQDGRAYLVMERLQGETLTERQRRDPPLRPFEALYVARDVARALAAAHATDVIHRDLKPDNIFIGSDGVVKVVDFGIAKALGKEDKPHLVSEPSLTEAHRVVGTPVYMSPEIITKEGLYPESDLYALGVILYEMIVGAPPFYEKDAIGTMYRHLHEEPQRLREVDSSLDIPGALETLVRHLLEKEHTKRPHSAEEVVRRLDALMRIAQERERANNKIGHEDDLSGDLTAVWAGGQAKKAPKLEEKPPPEKEDEAESRMPMLLVAAALALLVGFGATAALLWYFDQQAETEVQLPDDIDSPTQPTQPEVTH